MDDKQFEILNQQLEKMNSRLESVDEHLGHVDERLSRIEEDQHLIKKAVLDTNERVMKMEAVLENQHRIIELLSARSIEQEAHLKVIK
jgi:predicted  nucleic acid-binding Zn-ribbon protein